MRKILDRQAIDRAGQDADVEPANIGIINSAIGIDARVWNSNRVSSIVRTDTAEIDPLQIQPGEISQHYAARATHFPANVAECALRDDCRGPVLIQGPRHHPGVAAEELQALVVAGDVPSRKRRFRIRILRRQVRCVECRRGIGSDLKRSSHVDICRVVDPSRDAVFTDDATAMIPESMAHESPVCVQPRGDAAGSDKALVVLAGEVDRLAAQRRNDPVSDPVSQAKCAPYTR